jgi:hypothetical protein
MGILVGDPDRSHQPHDCLGIGSDKTSSRLGVEYGFLQVRFHSQLHVIVVRWERAEKQVDLRVGRDSNEIRQMTVQAFDSDTELLFYGSSEGHCFPSPARKDFGVYAVGAEIIPWPL